MILQESSEVDTPNKGGLIECWKYDKTSNNLTTEFCQQGCFASWETIDGKLSDVSYQGCHVAPLALCKDKNTCISPIDKVSPILVKDDEVIMDFCCCANKLCNDESSLKTTHNSELNFLNQKAEFSTNSLHLTQPISAQKYQEISIALIICSILAVMCFVFCLFFILKKKCFPIFSVSSLHINIKSCLTSKNSSKANSTLDHINECKPLTLSSNGSDQMSQRTVTEELHDVSDVQVDWSQIIGKGKFGHIYSASDQYTSKKFCFKVPSEPYGQAAFTNEVRILQMLAVAKHPNIIKYYGLHTGDSTTGFVMECCSMGSLSDFLDRHQIDDMKLCLSLVSDLASGIAFLHTYDIAEPYKQAVVHRDICTANMLLRSDSRLVVADFGVSAILDENDANNCSQDAKHLKVEGTPYYIAPEILDLTIDLSNTSASLKQADIYSLSLVMWEIVNRCSILYGSNSSSDVPPHSLPYQNDVKTTAELVDHVCVQGKRPKFNFGTQGKLNATLSAEEKRLIIDVEEIARKIVDTIEECWDKDEDARLAASCISRRMTELSRGLYCQESLKTIV